MFHVRRRPADYHPRKRKKKPQQRIDYRYEDSLPYFQELNPGKKKLPVIRLCYFRSFLSAHGNCPYETVFLATALVTQNFVNISSRYCYQLSYSAIYPERKWLIPRSFPLRGSC